MKFNNLIRYHLITYLLILLYGCSTNTSSSISPYDKFFEAEESFSNQNYDKAFDLYKDLSSDDSYKDSPTLISRLAESAVKLDRKEIALGYAKKLEELSSSEQVQKLVSNIYFSTGNFEDVKRILVKLINANPNGVGEESYVLLANSQILTSRFDQAEITLKNLLKIQPNSAAGYYYLAKLGEIKLNLKDEQMVKLVRFYYQQALKIAPDNTAVRLEYARFLVVSNKVDQAIKEIDQILKLEPSNLQARNFLAEIFLHKNNFKGAISAFEEAKKYEKDTIDTDIKIAIIQFQTGMIEDAEKKLKELVLKSPGNPKINYYLASILASNNQIDQSLQYINNIRSTDDLFVESRFLAAYFLKIEKRYTDSQNKIKEVLKKDPQNLNARKFLASVFQEEGRFGPAIVELKKVITIDGSDDNSNFLLGQLYDQIDKRDEAIAALKRAIELNPNNSEALNYLGYLIIDGDKKPTKEDLKIAREYIERAVNLQPTNGYYLDSLGWLNYIDGKLQVAKINLEEAVKYVSNDVVILEHLAKVYLDLGQAKDAKIIIELALKNFESNNDSVIKERLEKLLQEALK